MDARKIAEDNLFFYTVTGSHAYGMATEHSDVDYRGLFYAPQSVYMSLFKNVEQVEQFGSKDSVVYELSKFIKLLVDQNPNILELLWVNEKNILQTSPLYERLRTRREYYLSSKSKHTFSGYAISQLKRIRGHNKWITNPQPKRRPKEIDFISVVWNATNSKAHNKIVPFIGYQAFNLGSDLIGLMRVPEGLYADSIEINWHDKHEALKLIPIKELEALYGDSKQFDLVVKFNRQLYKEHVENWQHYWEWKDNRNEARASLEEKYGYDTKHAAHLVRLLRMGCEILRGEGIKVLRPDAEELLTIRNGKWTYEELVAYAGDKEKELENLYQTTSLPFNIDQDEIDQIAQEIYNLGWQADIDEQKHGGAVKRSWNIGYKKNEVSQLTT